MIKFKLLQDVVVDTEDTDFSIMASLNYITVERREFSYTATKLIKCKNIIQHDTLKKLLFLILIHSYLLYEIPLEACYL